MVLSDTQAGFRDAVCAYSQERIRPRAAEFEAAGAYPSELFAELASLGVMGMTAPLAAADGALSTIVSIQNGIIIPGILKDGSSAQQQRFLPSLIGGQSIGAFALTEAAAGSDAAAIRTRATRTCGGWHVNGSKQFVTSGRTAGLAMITTVTDPAAGKKGMSVFLVPTDRPGYVVEKVEHKLGQRASDTCALRFEDLFVESDLLLGKEGQGYRIALSNLEVGRIGIAAQSIGMAQAALDIAVAYAKDRRSMGKPIIKHQAVGFRLADLAARVESARQLLLHAACLKDHGLPCVKEASMAKLVASEAAEAICSGAIQTLGGYGYMEEFGLAKIYRDVRVCQIYEGTSDVQRMIIA